MNGLNSLTQMANRSDGLDKLASLAVTQHMTPLDRLVKLAGSPRGFFQAAIDMFGTNNQTARKILKGFDWNTGAGRKSAMDWISQNTNRKNYQEMMGLAEQHGMLDNRSVRNLLANKYNQIHNVKFKGDELFSQTGGMGGRRRFVDLASENSDIYEFNNNAFNRMKPPTPGVAPPGVTPDDMSVEDLTALLGRKGLTVKGKGGMDGLMEQARQHPGWAMGGGVAAGMVGSNMLGGRRGY